MSVWDDIKHQFIEVIEWTEESDDILAYRFPIAHHEIKQGAQLTVRESQLALLVDQGRPADVFAAGRHILHTSNLPILTKLNSWAYGFDSPFKSEVYFLSVRQKLGQRWGTPQPITCRDPELGSVQLRMFGAYSYHIADARTFYRDISGTRESFTTDDLVSQLLPTIVETAASSFARSQLSFLDMAANLPALSAVLRAALDPLFGKLGLGLDSFVVEAVTLPEVLQEALQARQAAALVGNLQDYARYQTAKSIPDAARNPSGLAGLGAALAVGARFGHAMGTGLSDSLLAPPPPAPSAHGPGVIACVTCAKDIGSGSGFCCFCGAMQKFACSRCQTELAVGNKFCGRCGQQHAPR